MSVSGTIRAAVASRFRLWLGIAVGFVLLYYAALLASLVVRFGKFPNYMEIYNWPANVAEIVRSTPAVSDMIPIIREEWLVEIGYFNTDYGLGISEWSLTLMPWKMLIVAALGALIATGVVLLLENRQCAAATLRGSAAAGALGSVMVATSSITLFWVVCCSTPTWVVGLAMLGLGVSTSLWLEPLGGWLTAAGFLLLGASIWMLARARTLAPAQKPRNASPVARAARNLGESHA